MRANEFITEANYGRYWCSTDKQWKYRKGPKQTRTVKEDFNIDDMVDYNGIKLHIAKDSDGLAVRAFDATGTKTLGYVEFFFNEQGELDPQDLTVNEKYHGQGIAKAMYDYVKDLGYTIIRSWDQTPASKAFWDKHQGEDARVWEDLEEGAPGKQVVQAILAVMPNAKEIWFHGSRATGKHRKDSDTDILVIVPDDVVGEDYLTAVRTLQNLASSYHNYDIQPTKSGRNIHQIAQEEGQLLWQQANENFADGKNSGRKGLAKRMGVNCKQSVDKLRKIAKNSSGEKQRMAHWCANMKAGKNK